MIAMYDRLVKRAAENGFEQYEISNFARDGKYAIHNTSYWQGEEYLGLGPAAHSYNQDSRQWNVRNNHQYMAAIKKGEPLFEKEILCITDKVNDYLLTGLRTIWGVSLTKIKAISPVFPEEFLKKIEEFKNSGHILQKDDILIIPQTMRVLSDYIASELMWVMPD